MFSRKWVEAAAVVSVEQLADGQARLKELAA